MIKAIEAYMLSKEVKDADIPLKWIEKEIQAAIEKGIFSISICIEKIPNTQKLFKDLKKLGYSTSTYLSDDVYKRPYMTISWSNFLPKV